MPRYYLHIRRGTRLEKDPDGVDVPDLDTACAEAMKVARECASLLHGSGGWRAGMAGVGGRPLR